MVRERQANYPMREERLIEGDVVAGARGAREGGLCR